MARFNVLNRFTILGSFLTIMFIQVTVFMAVKVGSCIVNELSDNVGIFYEILGFRYFKAGRAENIYVRIRSAS